MFKDVNIVELLALSATTGSLSALFLHGRITLARFPIDLFIASINQKLLRSLRVFLFFFRLSTCMLTAGGLTLPSKKE